MPVRAAKDKARLERRTEYFAVPAYQLLLCQASQLTRSIDDPLHYSRPSLDVLFESAADAYAERLMGIISSGANEDRSAGLAAVRSFGGATIVQELDSAPAPLVVLSALKKSPPDFVLPLGEIAALL
jgi:two-component system chemotaxis response regulator CheB